MFYTFLATLLPLALLDAVWLMLIAKSFYSAKIGHLMAAQPTWWAALLFYPLYALGLSYFVVTPNKSASLITVFIVGACFGIVAYATYDLTNQATLKDWPLAVTLVDILWGGLVSGLVSMAAVTILKYLS